MCVVSVAQGQLQLQEEQARETTHRAEEGPPLCPWVGGEMSVSLVLPDFRLLWSQTRPLDFHGGFLGIGREFSPAHFLCLASPEPWARIL